MAAVVFQLRFTCAAPRARPAATAAALARKALTKPCKPWQAVAQQGQLGLQLALAGHRAARKNFQNKHGAVQHFHLQKFLQVANLAARELCVKNGALCLQVLAQKLSLGKAAFAQVSGGLRHGALLHHLGHGLHARGFGQRGQLFHAFFHVIFAQVQPEQHGLHGGGVVLCFGHSCV